MRYFQILAFFLIIFSNQNVQAVPLAQSELVDQEWIHLLHDQPMYFLVGRPNTKVQFSIKAKVLKNADFYVAYTQRIFWNLFEKSSPFLDINYNPSLYYRIHLPGDPESRLDFIAYEHESNGKGDFTSRSWDRIGARYLNIHHFENGMKGEWSIRAWIPFNVANENKRLAQYRGIYEINFTISDFWDKNEISLRLYSGGKLYINPLLGGQELSFRFKGLGTTFLANAIFQIFQGYGESMLDYDQQIFGARIGIGI